MHGDSPSLRVGVVGAGRVGPSLASALRANGHEICGIVARSASGQERVAAMLPGVPVMSESELIAESEVVILTVPDAEIETVVKGCAENWRAGQLVMHVSGLAGLDTLREAEKAGALTASVHPVMTFTGTSLDVGRLQGAAAAVSASPLVLPLAQAIVWDWGGVPFTVGEADRGLYHAALSHGANHLVTLISESADLLAQAGVENPQVVLGPLVRAALEGALTSGMGALTGPIVRGDEGTVAAHLQALEGRRAESTYRHLSDATRKAWREHAKAWEETDE